MSLRAVLPVAFCCLLLLSGTRVFAQTSPLFETRGVWFATVLGDGNWPESTADDAGKQADDLRDRIQTAKSMGLNTFIMQVVARGDAMYPSTRLPWSVRLKGAGIDPGYDPLAVAVDEAHRLGMELHAWFNVFRIGDTSTVGAFENVTNPGHVYYEEPDWVVNASDALWLNPAFPEARQWLVDNVMEIVNTYDIDGIHFDFARYNQGGYPDDFDLFTQDPQGFTMLDNWRRNNVTLFVRDASDAIKQAKNWVKISATPLGNYTPFEDAWPALWAFDDTYQESRTWLTEGSVDFLAPQIYFDIGREPEPGKTFDSPDFSFLVDEWLTEAQGRPVFVGHGPYKPFVFDELDTQIALTRNDGARGQVYFRYTHILPFDFSESYPNMALPWPMSHRFFAFAPDPPADLILSATTDSSGNPVYALDWPAPAGHAMDPVGSYAIFRNQNADPDVAASEHLLAVVNQEQTTYADRSAMPGIEYHYSVVGISRLGIDSDPSPVASTGTVSVDNIPGKDHTLSIASIYPNPATEEVVIRIDGTTGDRVIVHLYDVIGRLVYDGVRHGSIGGPTDVVVDLQGFPAGTYLVRVSTPTSHDMQPFIKLNTSN